MSWLERAGVQARPYRALLSAFLWMDLRNETYGQATKSTAKAIVPPLYLVLGQFLLTSCLASLALFMRTDAWFFAFAGLSLSFVLLFSCLVVEFHEVVIDAADSEVIGHRPITSRTYAAARLTNLGFYVGLMTIANTIFPAIIGAALPDASPAFLPLYVVSSILVSLVTTSLVILLYTAFGAGRFLDDLRGLLAWVQIIAIMIVFYGGQLMLRNADGSVEHLAARPPAWIYHLPMAWLADAITGAGRTAIPSPLAALSISSAVTAALLAVVIVRIGGAWRKICAGEAKTEAGRARGEALSGTTARGAIAKLIADRSAASTYWLVRAMFARDQELALRCWPAFGLAAAALVLGYATDQLASPLTEQTPRIVLSIAIPVLLAGAVPGLYQNLRYSRDHQAGWLILTAPLGSKKSIASGVRWALRRTFFVPVAIAVAAALSYVWRSPIDVAVHLAICWAMMELAASISEAQVLVEPPFMRSPARGAASQMSLAAIYAGTAAAAIAAAQYGLAGSLSAQLALAGALIVAVSIADRWARGVVETRAFWSGE